MESVSSNLYNHHYKMNELIFGFLAIILQGIFAGSETAFTRANWIRITTWQKKNTTTSLLRLRAHATLKLLEQKERVLIITLIFTNLFVVIATAIFSRFFIIHFGPVYTFVAVVIVVLLSLILGDFLPKAIAQAFPEYWVVAFGSIIQFLSTILAVFLPKTPAVQYHKLSRQDFLYLLKEKESKQSLVTNQMAKALFDFSRLSVSEIMVPKERIVAFWKNDDLKNIKKTIEKYRFSRYPVFQIKRTQKNTAIKRLTQNKESAKISILSNENSKLIGIIHIKDILIAMQKKQFQINKMIRKPYIVNSNEKASAVLKAMSRKGEHLAIVQTQQAQTVGIITLEDLLEEVVGEIRSEA